MTREKSIGLITMVVAGLLVFAVLAMSEGWYTPVDFLRLLMGFLKVRLLKDEDTYDSYFIDIPTKYLVLLCLIGLATGFLLYKGVIHLPQRSEQKPARGDEPAP
jgi:hypothetical protein